jgi:hypothetical protein
VGATTMPPNGIGPPVGGPITESSTHQEADTSKLTTPNAGVGNANSNGHVSHQVEYGQELFQKHALMLAESGITPERAALRGYRSVSDPQYLLELGFSSNAVKRIGGFGVSDHDGLLIPLLDKRGSTWGYQLRPDSPCLADGKLGDGSGIRKYETPLEQRNGLDIPPGVGELLDAPGEELFLTEGTKKADCAAAQGLCCVSISGVWNWRGRNRYGGKLAVGDWDDIALNDREVILAFDSDVVRKPEVHKALTRLSEFLKYRGATVKYLHLPYVEEGK